MLLSIIYWFATSGPSGTANAKVVAPIDSVDRAEKVLTNLRNQAATVPGKEAVLKQVATELASTGLPAELLSLELTESALIDGNPTTERTLNQLTEIGIQLGLDDFGTGFSSLAYLKRFPIDFVKIDRTFTDGLGTDDNDTAIVKATIALSHSLGLRVVAEGVETTAQRELLRELGCDFGQGYLFARPLDVIAFETLLNDPR